MPDLTEEPLEAPLKQWEPKSFSSRFVTHVKPESVKVVRRKRSGLADDHFEAVIVSSEDEAGGDQPPCNCPRHGGSAKQDFKSQLGRHRLKSTHQPGLLQPSSLGKPLTIIVNSSQIDLSIFFFFSSFN